MINKKKICHAISALLIGGSLFIMPCANAEIYTGEGEYTASKYETLEVAEQRAIKEARKHAQEQAGIYIESYSHMKNFKLLEDEIITIAGGIQKDIGNPIIKTFVMEDGKSIKICATVKVEIDDSEIDKWLNKSIENRNQINEQLEDLRKKYEAQKKRIAELEAKTANIKTPQDEQEIKAAFANEDKIFLSNHKVEEGWKFWNNKNFSNALEIFDEAINLNPDNAEAYAGKGTAYGDLGKYEQSISYLNKAIEIGLNKDFVYNNRGLSYANLKQYKKAISDYNKVIELNPNFAAAYNDRGVTYVNLKQYRKALDDCNKAIELDPNDANFYGTRGLAYIGLKDYQKAVEDFNKVIELAPRFAAAYNDRGKCYQALGEKEKASADFAKAKQLGYTE